MDTATGAAACTLLDPTGAIGEPSTDDGVDATAATSTTIPRPSTVLRVGAEDWPQCLNPLTCADRVLHDQVLQHVLPVTFEVDADGGYVASPLLVSTPEPSATDDGVEIVYELSADARWADGRPITSSDFVGTWRAIIDTPAADRLRYDRIVAVDDTGVPCAGFRQCGSSKGTTGPSRTFLITSHKY